MSAENGCYTVKDKADYGAFIPSALDDYGLDVYEFRVYCRITRRAGSGKCFESHTKIAKFCKMSERKVRDAIDLLIAAKLIDRIDRPGKSSEYSRTHESNWMHPSKLDGLRESIQRKDKRQRLTTPVGSNTPIGSATPVGSDTATPVGSDTATPVGSDTATPVGSATPPLSDPTDEGTPLRYSHEGTPPLTPQGESENEGEEFEQVGTPGKELIHPVEKIEALFTNAELQPWRSAKGVNGLRIEFVSHFRDRMAEWGQDKNPSLADAKKVILSWENSSDQSKRDRLQLSWEDFEERSKREVQQQPQDSAHDRAAKWNELRSRLAPFPEYEVYVHTDGDFQELRARHVVSGVIKIERFLPGLAESLERSRQAESSQAMPF